MQYHVNPPFLVCVWAHNYPYYFNFASSVVDLQSAKVLLLTPKYKIIMVLSNHSFFQYCDSNIGLFSIAPGKVITLNPLSILFGISCLLFFLWLSFYSYRSSNYRHSYSRVSFSLLKAIAIRLPLLFVKRATTIWEAIQKRSHEPIYKTYTKI